MEKDRLLWEEEIEVRYIETDQTGTVHHAYIPVYFEKARGALFKHFTRSYAAIERRGVFAPIVAMTLEILKPAFYEDVILVRIRPFDFTGVRLTLSYEIVRKDTEELLATGLTTNLFVDEEKKPLVLKNRFPEIYEEIVKVFEDAISPDLQEDFA
jgi:acyl-CoA thioester hydrolase